MTLPCLTHLSFPYLTGSVLFNIPFLAMGVLLLLVYIVAVFFKPTIALFAFAFTLAFNDFLNLPVTQGGFKLSTAILLSAFFIILAKILIRKEPDLQRVLSKKVSLLVLLFLLAMIISLVNSQNIKSATVEIQEFIYCVVLFFFVLFTMKDASVLKKVVIVMVCGGIFISLLGIVEAKAGTIYGLFSNHSLLGSDVPEITITGPENRINGVLGDADFHGMYMGLIFSLAFCLFFIYKTKLARLSLAAAMLLCLFNIVGAASRGAALGSFVSFIALWFFLPLPRRWITLTGLLGGIFTFGCLLFFLFPNLEIERFYRPEGKAKKTLELRKNNVLIGLAMGLDHPIIGRGPAGFSIDYHRYASRIAPTAEKKTTRPLNVYIQVFVEQGIAGLILFLGIVFSALKPLFPLARDALGEYHPLSAAVLATLCGYSIFMMFTGLIDDQNYWLLIAMAVAIGLTHSSRVVKTV